MALQEWYRHARKIFDGGIDVKAPADKDILQFNAASGHWEISQDSYSASEVKTGKIWIDGRPIYRKVISCGALPNATTKNTAHGITFASTTLIISLTGVASKSDSFLPLPYSTNTTANLLEFRATGTNIVIISSADFSSYTASYVIMEYVK